VTNYMGKASESTWQGLWRNKSYSATNTTFILKNI
jgi:hypothetical protein